MLSQDQISKEIQAAYAEFSQALEQLRKTQRELFKRAAKDLEQIAITKVRKNLGLQWAMLLKI